ncbi:MAG: hypothetical protein UR19_C0016G0003 [Candidatus Nomurabacteria bacterium GW2011_GWF1_31_48]|uniref:Uncharacterized protein n=2 Tax=Patescibacteria group TaxID=1783273 RepID=A0A0G0ARA2_9BACT|nr:MAG: hypothetical protein UR19_C0016G0003 [Candidatus Nomurabacteria bacterium GW2011_GWF1_31_48]KKT96844.1 MAG: hypothetical protein UW99_C0048G0004 [Candidatus Collierbacteria bacterium GW2011_GWC2_45_15]
MSNEKISSIISIAVAIIVLVASYFQWWNLTYNGAMITKGWVKIMFGALIIMLFIAILLIIK